MPFEKSARVEERRRIRNAPLRTKARSSVKKARGLIESGEIKDATVAVQTAVVALDKAAQKGALHKGNASRRKSRLMRQLHQAQEG